VQEGAVEWKESWRRSGEFTVMNITEGDGGDNGKASEKDLERALIIAFGMGSVIVVGAMANRAYEESRKKR
jgi:hypothetical protein